MLSSFSIGMPYCFSAFIALFGGPSGGLCCGPDVCDCHRLKPLENHLYDAAHRIAMLFDKRNRLIIIFKKGKEPP